MLDAADSILLIVDAQARLLPALHDSAKLLARMVTAAKGARALGMPVLATEHWPEKIGATHADLLPYIDSSYGKRHFNAAAEAGFLRVLPQRQRVLLAGAEAHICVLQTGLGLAAAGFHPVLLADCIGSRAASSHALACERWRQRGLEVLNLEMALFECMRTPEHPGFKQVLELIR